MEDTSTAARVNGWRNRETYVFALEYAEIWDIPALLKICGGDSQYAATCLEESAWETMCGEYMIDGRPLVSRVNILRAVDWMEIIKTFTEDEG